MERTAECHCGSLRAIASGEPESVDLCHCKACQRRTGTAFHLGATYLKDRVRLEGARNIYERDGDSGNRIRFHFCPNCGSNLYWGKRSQPGSVRDHRGQLCRSKFPVAELFAVGGVEARLDYFRSRCPALHAREADLTA